MTIPRFGTYSLQVAKAAKDFKLRQEPLHQLFIELDAVAKDMNSYVPQDYQLYLKKEEYYKETYQGESRKLLIPQALLDRWQELTHQVLVALKTTTNATLAKVTDWIADLKHLHVHEGEPIGQLLIEKLRQ